MKRTLFLTLMLLLPAPAWAIPKLISFQGVLTDKAGQPVDGSFELTFRLYKVETGGTAAWEEKQTVNVSDGVYHTLLGNAKALPTDFNVDYWLSVQIGSKAEASARFRLASVAYAFRADSAASADTASTLQGKKPADFADTAHAHTDLAKSTDLTAYAKSTDIKTYTAGSGLALLASTFSLLGTCSAGQLLKFNGTDWTCAADAGGTAYTAGSGLTLAGSSFAIDFSGGGAAATASRSDHAHDAAYVNEAQASSVTSSMIVDGQIVDADIALAATIAMSKLEGDPKTAGTINTGTNPIDWTKLKGVPAGLADGADSDTTYSAGSGLSLVGTTFSLLNSCVLNQVLKFNGTNWACSADTDTTYSASTGLLLAAGAFSVNFAGSGVAATSAKSDHNHTGAYEPAVSGKAGVIGPNTTQQLIQFGNQCEAVANSENVAVTFSPAFAGTPRVTVLQTGGTATVAGPTVNSKTATDFSIIFTGNTGTVECFDWIAIGPN